MAIVLSKMIDEVRGGLQGWASDEEQSTTLAALMGNLDLSFSVTNVRGVATGISAGIVEIGQELVYADTVGADGTVTVTPWGRGYQSTVAAIHAAGVRVISQPSFPRAKIVDAINQVLERVFPDVFAVKVIELTTTVPVITYLLPADCQNVLGIRWMRPDGRQYWQAATNWRMSPGGGTLFGDTGRSVDIADAMLPGRPLQITYAAKPAQLVNETDDFETVTGLNLGVEDVITLGATVQMLPPEELSRLQQSSVEQQNRAQLVAPSAALTATRALEQRFQQRLAEERRTLQRLYPPRVNRSWP